MNPFFSRRVLTLTVVMTIVLYVSGGFVLHKLGNYLEQRRKEQAVTQQKSALDKLSNEEKAIKKTQEYMLGSIALPEASERMFFGYLQRKFDLDPILGVAGPPINISRDPRTYPEQINYMVRIAYPDEIVREKPEVGKLDSNVAVTNIYSANCDHLELPANFWAVMEESVRLGGYYVSHVALALEMMESNRCMTPPIAAEIDSKVAEEMVKIISDSNTVADLHYESIAFLLMRDRRDLVKRAWIDQIISEQLEDGFWAQKVGDSKVDFHSTILAFWSLLEYSRPDTPDEPIILRPTTAP